MIYRFVKSTFLFFFITFMACGRNTGRNKAEKEPFSAKEKNFQKDSTSAKIVVGANRTAEYLPFLLGKKVGIVANQGSVIFKKQSTSEFRVFTPLIDSLNRLKVSIKEIFVPEHGFRGNADAGEQVSNGKDPKTGIPVISLYGNNKKPTSEQLKGLDILVYDLQDVGARFYTYISTLTYVMEACAENNIPLLILDRPNPNGSYIDGPILEPDYKSFVGMHPIPVVYGMTSGEYAKMVNGEKWLNKGVQCDITIIGLENYNHQKKYSLPIKPSPNLPNDKAINLYPSLCFFEGTNVNAGRGTNNQFQVFGSPYLEKSYFHYSYTPQSREGAKNPKHKGELCYGENLASSEYLSKINLSWLLEAYRHTSKKAGFFNSYFNTLAGNAKLQQQIKAGMTEGEIRDSWKPGLEKFKKIRKKYLIYK